MKKIILSILALAAVMVSCSSNDDSAGVSSSTSESIATYIAEIFPAASVVSTTSSSSKVTATLNTGETVTFSKDGSVIAYANNACKGLAADSLVVPADSVAGHNHDGKGPGKHGHGKHGHDRHYKNEISVDSLSTTLNEYISTNYAGDTVIHAEVDTICQGIVTEVFVCSSTKEPIKLVFDATGTFIFKAERIKYADVPAEISAAVTANYSTYSVKKRAEKFTLADGSLQYKVFLSFNKTRKSVTFNADGTVSCEK